jgi:hypothetical protein
MDNIFIARLWRSLKYEEVYLHTYASVAMAKAGSGAWLTLLQRGAPVSEPRLSHAAANLRGRPAKAEEARAGLRGMSSPSCEGICMCRALWILDADVAYGLTSKRGRGRLGSRRGLCQCRSARDPERALRRL